MALNTTIGGGGESTAGAEIDGHSTAIGSTTDAESVSGNGSVIALLKRHRTLLAAIIVLLGGGLPALLLSGSLDTRTATASAAAPAYTEGSSVKLSTDLAGALRTAGGGGGGGNPTAGRLDSIRYLQKLDTLSLLRAGRLDSVRRVQKVDTLSLLLAGRLDSVRRVQKMDTLTKLFRAETLATQLAGRMDSIRRVQKVDTLSLLLAGRLDSLRRVQKVDTVSQAAIISSPLMVTISPAAATAGTITLPAAGAGLFHYITALYFSRASTAALAGTATLAITTTNLPAGTQWRVGNAMIAGGTQIDVNMQFVSPLKSSVANTATTFVFPSAGAAVLWNCTAWYYTGP